MTIADNNERFTFVLDKDLKAKLQILADADKRKLGNYIAKILERHMVEFEMDILETYGYSSFYEAHESIFNNLKINLFSSDIDFEMKEKLEDIKRYASEESSFDLEDLTPELKQFIFRNKISIKKESSDK